MFQVKNPLILSVSLCLPGVRPIVVNMAAAALSPGPSSTVTVRKAATAERRATAVSRPSVLLCRRHRCARRVTWRSLWNSR